MLFYKPSPLILKRRDFGSQLNRDRLGKEFSMCVKEEKGWTGDSGSRRRRVCCLWLGGAGGHPGVGQVVPYQPGNGRQGAE